MMIFIMLFKGHIRSMIHIELQFFMEIFLFQDTHPSILITVLPVLCCLYLAISKYIVHIS